MSYMGSLRYVVPDEPPGEVPNMDLFPVAQPLKETWVDAQARICPGDSQFMCEDVLRNLLDGALTVAMTHFESPLTLPEAMDAIRAMMGTEEEAFST